MGAPSDAADANGERARRRVLVLAVEHAQLLLRRDNFITSRSRSVADMFKKAAAP
eukprot:SAG11_NODE_772_length_7254_cov_1.857582_4_plen_55_part_00